MTLESTAFEHEGTIPRLYTCDGKDLSPPLSWKGAPEGTKAFALLVDDPDAPRGTWVHWVLFNLPPHLTGLPQDASRSDALSRPAVEGTNGWKSTGYRGPCPPSGSHRYFFRLYALDEPLDLGADATAHDVSFAMAGRVLAATVLMGRYARGDDGGES